MESHLHMEHRSENPAAISYMMADAQAYAHFQGDLPDFGGYCSALVIPYRPLSIIKVL
jgi:hypothetical protein